MSKITEAQAILKALGLPAAQQNEMSALTLLALCSEKKILLGLRRHVQAKGLRRRLWLS